jgi:hypothetical protein
MARKFAERDEIKQGLLCVLSTVEPCRTFSLARNGRSPRIMDASGKLPARVTVVRVNQNLNGEMRVSICLDA